MKLSSTACKLNVVSFKYVQFGGYDERESNNLSAKRPLIISLASSLCTWLAMAALAGITTWALVSDGLTREQAVQPV